ncbi:MAG: hypothetical protein HC840_00680 [Leptolyngbyaceae cyanobacterium RM2_2_4]|nr:hypothetical protein [Leptolyngbyaceae cyanobacterium RM2_2_4]
MSGTMTILIAGACIGLSGNSKLACEKALEAGSKKTGIEQNVNRFQKTVERKAKDQAEEYIGQEGVDVVGGGVFIAKTIVDKSVQFNAPTFDLCDKVTSQVGVDKYSVQLEWGF